MDSYIHNPLFKKKHQLISNIVTVHNKRSRKSYENNETGKVHLTNPAPWGLADALNTTGSMRVRRKLSSCIHIINTRLIIITI